MYIESVDIQHRVSRPKYTNTNVIPIRTCSSKNNSTIPIEF